ncbi:MULTISPECIES: hypothetical protein [Pseudomonas]|uniref:hypothetical protein n=1 Tax=Pseudomonas TaxID=286 RepID=UPI00126A23E7|nr:MULTISPECIES: hypothetical protein [Pseudomonas]MBJ2181606.1 hypothetical protein [Pseudomonas veronii]
MDRLELFMPAIVLGLSFMLKLFIDRSTTMPQAIESTLELPVDITFLAISLVVGFTISPTGNPREGMAWFAFYMFAAIFIVFFWRRSIKYFDVGHVKSVVCLAGANYLMAIFALVNSVNLVMGNANGGQ